jgi:hypothetical protein
MPAPSGFTVRHLLGVPEELRAWYPPRSQARRAARPGPEFLAWAEAEAYARCSELNAQGIRADIIWPRRREAPMVVYRLQEVG